MTAPYKIFADESALEQSALDQFYSAIELPCVHSAALMPDAHTGYSLPIGSVVATKGMIFPSWVGYDIGCGMCALPTTFNRHKIEAQAPAVYEALTRAIPTGFSSHSKKRAVTTDLNEMQVSPHLYGIYLDRKAQFQIGTLGGGNHFIEVGADEHDRVWIIIHSGSRGVGHGTAQHYMRLASGDGKVREGHYGFDVDTVDGQDYIRDARWCMLYALENRKRMVAEVVKQLALFCFDGEPLWNELINRHHNHVEPACLEVPGKGGTYHVMDRVWIHRKGATHAENGMMGVIPGNMRDGSFIVRGKGNPDSIFSSSHGAGRVLSRKKAKATLDVEEFVEQMDGVACGATAQRIDEAPGAYKNIFDVMAQQKDLVEVVAHVKPIVNVKG